MTHYIVVVVTTSHPRMGQRLWIDDASQAVKGSRRAVREEMTRCIITTCKEMKKWSLAIADKPVVTCTSYKDAHMLRGKLGGQD
eukprot:4673123-Pyramimonas_sp.AAC.1